MKDTHGIIFAQRLKKLRAGKNLTQTELAEMLGYKNYTTVSKWESGDSLPRGKELKLLAEIFDISTDYLLGLDNTLSQPSTTLTLVKETTAKLEESRQKNVLSYAEHQLKEQESTKVAHLPSKPKNKEEIIDLAAHSEIDGRVYTKEEIKGIMEYLDQFIDE